MATSIYKYSTLSDAERLQKIRAGDYDVYKEEIARINENLKNKKELGLDYQDQLDWVNTVNRAKLTSDGYFGSITQTERDYLEKLGGSYVSSYAGKVPVYVIDDLNRKSIADTDVDLSSILVSGGNKQNNYAASYSDSSYSGGYSDGLTETQRKKRDELMEKLNEELEKRYSQTDSYYDNINNNLRGEAQARKNSYYETAMNNLPSMYEKFANSGISFDGGKARTEQMAYSNAVNKNLASIDNEFIRAANENNVARGKERSQAYSEFVNRLAAETERLDELDYRQQRDAADDAYRQQQFNFEQYKYNTQLQQSALDKTLEQERWEKEFGLKMSAQEFDKLVQQDKLVLENDKYKFDVDKYWSEYDLKSKQYEAENEMKNKEFELKQSGQELDFEKFLKEYELKSKAYDFDVEKFLKEYELKTKSYDLDAERLAKEYELKNKSYDFDVEKFLKEYELKSKAYDFDVEKFLREYELDLQKYNSDTALQNSRLELDRQKLDAERESSAVKEYQWEAEMELKKQLQEANLLKEDKEYALKFLDSIYTGGQQSSSDSSSSASSSTRGGGGGVFKTPYEKAIEDVITLKTEYVSNGKNTMRKYSDNYIDNYISDLNVSESEKARLRKLARIK